MSQIYLNGPSTGRAMSAEEFTRRANDGPGACQCPGSQPPVSDCGCGSTSAPTTGCGCGCNGTGAGCPADDCGQDTGYCQEMVCTCRPAAPTPLPPQVQEGCCCKQSFRAALGLLCDEQISSLLDFDAAAFITDTYIAGADQDCRKHSGHGHRAEDEMEAEDRRRPSCPASCSDGASDNLGALTGSFRRFAPCTCDLLDIDAELHATGRKECAFTATQVSLCQLDAVVIQGARACAEGELTANEVTARNFRCLRQRLAQRLSPCGSPCGESCCSCASDGRDCCCAAGLLSTLAQNNLSRRVSLVAGLLMLHNVTLLGTVGNVLVLSSDADNRLYFVCVNSVQFIG